MRDHTHMRLFITTALAVFYATQVLLFRERETHQGPFPSETEFVYRKRNGYSQPVNLFDRIRRFTLNPYDVDADLGLWHVNERAMERWTCPKCLSAWVSLFFVTVILLLIDPPRSFRQLADKCLWIGALSGSTTLLSALYERMMTPHVVRMPDDDHAQKES